MRVLLVHRTRARLDTVARLNISNPATTLLASEDVAERIRARNDGRPVDAALICTTRAGAPSALCQAVESVRHRGCIDLVTNYPEHATVPRNMDASALKAVRSGNICGSPREGQYLSADISGRRIAFASHRGTSHAHLKKAMHALSHNVAAYMKLITHVLPLREAAAAIQGLSESTSHAVHGKDCIKLVIDMSSSALGSPERMSRHA